MIKRWTRLQLRRVSSPLILLAAAAVLLSPDSVAAQDPPLASLVLNPSSVVGGLSATGTVTLSAPAPPGGTVVTLTNPKPQAATIPPSVLVPEGSTASTFPITTVVVSQKYIFYFSASAGGVTRSSKFYITVYPIMYSLTLSPSTVKGGNPSMGTVVINGPGMSGGETVTLTSAQPGVASVPPSMTIAEGSTMGTFPITTYSGFARTRVAITASLDGRPDVPLPPGHDRGNRTVRLTVNP